MIQINTSTKVSGNPVNMTLTFNSEDNQDFRQHQARQLLSFCRQWPSVQQAQLGSYSSPTSATEGTNMDAAGQIELNINPEFTGDFIKLCKSWLQMANAKPVKLKIDNREAEFPANADADQLEAWIKAE